MKSTKALCLILILGFSAILGQALQIVTNYDGIEDQRPVCRAPGQFQWEQQDLELEYDYTSFAPDTGMGDSVPVFVTKGDDQTNWKFTYFQNTLEQPIEQECTGSEGLDLVVLLDEYLFLTDNGVTFFVCKMDLGFSFTTPVPTLRVQAPTTDVPGPITTFIPYWRLRPVQINSDILHILIGDSTGSGVFTYAWPENPADGSQIDVVSMIGLKFPSTKTFTTFLGSDGLYYDSVDNKFVYYDGSTPNVWNEDPVVPPQGSVVSQYRLYHFRFIFTIMNANGIGGAVYHVIDQKLVEIPYTDSITQPETIYSDNLFNFVLVSQTEVVWYSFRLNFGTFLTKVPRAQFQLGGTGLVDIAVSGSKLVAFFEDKIQYFKHITEDDIKLIYEKTLANEFDFDTDISAKILISCLCESLKKFVCYSSTLNCIIIKKGGAQCYQPDIPQTAS